MRALLVVMAAVCLAACAGDGNELEGSLGAFHDLTYSEVRGRLYDSDLSIEFVHHTGEVPIRVTLDRDVVDDAGGAAVLDLGDGGDVTGSSGGSPLPPFVDGELVLAVYAPGFRVAGGFDATFDAAGTEVTLTGTFDAILEIVD